MPLYWEDFKVGETVEMGSHMFTEAEIIESRSSSTRSRSTSTRWRRRRRPSAA